MDLAREGCFPFHIALVYVTNSAALSLLRNLVPGVVTFSSIAVDWLGRQHIAALWLPFSLTNSLLRSIPVLVQQYYAYDLARSPRQLAYATSLSTTLN